METLYIVMPAYNEKKISERLFGYGIQSLGGDCLKTQELLC